MEEDFYASIKLKTGEEIFTRVVPFTENNKYMLLVTNPIIINNFEDNKGRNRFKIEPWLKTTTEDIFIINMNDVITISETKNKEMILLHQSYIEKFNLNKLSNDNKSNTINRKMGYISSIKEAKEMLENIYKNL